MSAFVVSRSASYLFVVLYQVPYEVRATVTIKETSIRKTIRQGPMTTTC